MGGHCDGVGLGAVRASGRAVQAEGALGAQSRTEADTCGGGVVERRLGRRAAWPRTRRDTTRAFKASLGDFVATPVRWQGSRPRAAGGRYSGERSSGLQEEWDFILFTCVSPSPTPCLLRDAQCLLNDE